MWSGKTHHMLVILTIFNVFPFINFENTNPGYRYHGDKIELVSEEESLKWYKETPSKCGGFSPIGSHLSQPCFLHQ